MSLLLTSYHSILLYHCRFQCFNYWHIYFSRDGPRWPRCWFYTSRCEIFIRYLYIDFNLKFCVSPCYNKRIHHVWTYSTRWTDTVCAILQYYTNKVYAAMFPQSFRIGIKPIVWPIWLRGYFILRWLVITELWKLKPTKLRRKKLRVKWVDTLRYTMNPDTICFIISAAVITAANY